ncbi:MAG: TRAP transporter small permease [Desulfobacteraceae bacterium]|nr:TRAP transporter small permease [Desulfobacteraceae bacterium]
MKLLETGINGLVRLMYYVSGLAIVLMMLITTTDVCLRFCVTLYKIFQWEFLSTLKPVPGSYDLVALCGSVAAAFAMAHTTVQSGHVAVELLVRLLAKKKQVFLKFITDTLSGIFFAVLAWRCVLYARDLKESGEVSMTMQLPFHPFVYLLAFSALAVTFVFLTAIIKDLRKEPGK